MKRKRNTCFNDNGFVKENVHDNRRDGKMPAVKM